MTSVVSAEDLDRALEPLRTELAELRAQLDSVTATRELPAFLTLREAAELAGISYESLRRPENTHLRPGARTHDCIIAGKRMYRRETVENWLLDLGK